MSSVGPAVFLSILIGLAGGPCTCDVARLENGWCKDHQVGYVAAVPVKSAVLFETLDAHGHTIDPKAIECASCQKALATDGSCESCHFGFVDKKLYFSKLSYALAKGTPQDPTAMSCRVCRDNATRPPAMKPPQTPGDVKGNGWCVPCGRGLVGNVSFTNRTDFDRAEHEYEVLLFAVRTAARCETCAIVVFTGGTCPTCRLAFRNGKLVPATLRDPILFIRAPDPGLRYAYYEGERESLRGLGEAEPLRRGETAELAIAVAGGEHFAIEFGGFIEVPADGVYQFFLESDDGSQLLIADEMVVDNDGRNPPPEKSGAIGLRAGYHQLTVRYFNATGAMHLRVSIAGPGVEKQPVTARMLFR